MRPFIVLSWLCGVLLCAPPLVAQAEGPATPDPADQPASPPGDEPSTQAQGEQQDEPDPKLEAARAIYERGVADYSAGRYEQAVDAWLEAYNALPPSYESATIRAELIYNIATAQKRAFDIDEDLTHLRQARASLQNFAQGIDEAYPEGLERDREREQATRVLKELDAQIASVQAQREAKARELAALARPDFDPVLDARLAKQNRSLIVGGGVLTGLGLAGMATMGAGFAMGMQAEKNIGALETGSEIEARGSEFTRGTTGNALAFTGSIIGGLSLIAGGTMLGIGLKRERKRKAHRGGQRGDSNLRLEAERTGHYSGLRLRGRF